MVAEPMPGQTQNSNSRNFGSAPVWVGLSAWCQSFRKILSDFDENIYLMVFGKYKIKWPSKGIFQFSVACCDSKLHIAHNARGAKIKTPWKRRLVYVLHCTHISVLYTAYCVQNLYCTTDTLYLYSKIIQPHSLSLSLYLQHIQFSCVSDRPVGVYLMRWDLGVPPRRFQSKWFGRKWVAAVELMSVIAAVCNAFTYFPIEIVWSAGFRFFEWFLFEWNVHLRNYMPFAMYRLAIKFIDDLLQFFLLKINRIIYVYIFSLLRLLLLAAPFTNWAILEQ